MAFLSKDFMPMRIGTLMPELNDATEWLSSNAEEAHAIAKGQPTLVHFWAVSCGICKENMPKVHEWRDQLKENGLRVIAIHMPRYEADTNMANVREAVTTYDISEPCAVDNLHKLRDAFQNEQGFVPAYYLFDAEGKLKSFAAGERGVAMLGAAVNRLLGLTA